MSKLTEGTKFDDNKLRLDLLPPEFEEAVAEILTYGAKKYEDENWRKGIKYKRVYGALRRHLLAWWKGEDYDNETGFSHLWHAACNLAFLITYEAHPSEYKKFDDRFLYSRKDNK